MEEPQTRIIWSTSRIRWRIDIHEAEGEIGVTHVAFLTGDMGQGIYRSRWMAIGVLWGLTEMMDRAKRLVDGRIHIDEPRKVPKTPHCLPVKEWACGAFCLVVTVHRNDDDSLSFTVAVYDADDSEAPVLWATDGEIDLLLSDLHEAQQALSAYTEG